MNTKILTEKEAEDLLEKEGFKVVPRILIKKKEELQNVKIKFPWVMKISSRHIVHKAKLGGTILEIKNLEQAKKAFDKLKSLNHFEGILIQHFMSGEELILGIKETPEFGKVIMFGKGGSNVENDKDISFRIIPLKKKDVKKMIEEIKFYPTLKEKNINLRKIEENIIILSKLAKKYNKIEELDINPLIVNEKEALVVDARISFK